MQRTRKNKANQTLISIILSNLAISIFVIAIGVVLVFFSVSKIENNFWKRTDMSYLLSQKKNLQKEAYDRLNTGGGFQFSGYFEILNSDAKVIYCSNAKKHNTYNTQALAFIPDSKTGESFYMEKIPGMEEDTMFLITRYITEDKQEHIAGIMTVDKEGYIYYDSIGMDADKLTRKALTILQENSDRTFLQKRRFVTNDGQIRYLLYHTGNRNAAYHDLEKKVEALGIVACIVLSALCILFFCRRIVKALRKPINNLMERINDFGENRELNVTETDTFGPVEFRQITESFGALEEKLISSEKERRKLEEDRQKLLTDISHDLKTPATVIRGYAEALSSGVVNPEEQPQYLEIIRKRSEQLSELIHAFFEYNKVNYPGLQLNLETDDFCEFFREFFADRYEELNTGGSTVTVDIPEEVMPFSFDHALMKRLLENITGNSLHHNGGHTDLYAGLSQTNDAIIIRLGDNGKGIAPELRESVFSPFVTGNKARTGGEGSGLGLSIAKRIAELHHGTIRLLPEGTDGWKVLFEIRLPKETLLRNCQEIK